MNRTTLRGSGPAPHGYVRCAVPDCSDGPHYHPRVAETPIAEDTDAQRPDRRPGFYYVSCVDGTRRALLRGPWTSHAAAIAAVPAVRAEAERADAWACWYAFGTARSETDLGPGVLGGAT